MSKKIVKHEYYGNAFTEQLNDWIAKTGDSQEHLAELIGVQKPDSITNWKMGYQKPSPANEKRICEIFKVDRSVFYPKSNRDKYKYSKTAITNIGNSNATFAVEHGLDLDLVQVLHELVDFDSLFPKYSPIVKDPSSFLDGPQYIRANNADSAVIDKNLEFLQIKRDGKIYTMHEADLAYLKEIQDKVKEYVEFLFYKRSKEMEDEVQRFNEGSVRDLKDGGKAHIKIDKEFILNNDPYAKYFDWSDYDEYQSIGKEGK